MAHTLDSFSRRRSTFNAVEHLLGSWMENMPRGNWEIQQLLLDRLWQGGLCQPNLPAAQHRGTHGVSHVPCQLGVG